MNNQDRMTAIAILEEARILGEVIIELDRVSPVVYQNVYHMAKNLESDLNVEVVIPKQSIRIFRNG